MSPLSFLPRQAGALYVGTGQERGAALPAAWGKCPGLPPLPCPCCGLPSATRDPPAAMAYFCGERILPLAQWWLLQDAKEGTHQTCLGLDEWEGCAEPKGAWVTPPTGVTWKICGVFCTCRAHHLHTLSSQLSQPRTPLPGNLLPWEYEFRILKTPQISPNHLSANTEMSQKSDTLWSGTCPVPWNPATFIQIINDNCISQANGSLLTV